jgi:hypothetical protein
LRNIHQVGSANSRNTAEGRNGELTILQAFFSRAPKAARGYSFVFIRFIGHSKLGPAKQGQRESFSLSDLSLSEIQMGKEEAGDK